jgi:hypothetical protein
VRLALAVGIALLTAAACGGASKQEPRPAPVPIPNVLQQLASTHRTLDTRALAADALDPAGLARLLRSAGYLGGSEREFAGRSSTFEHVVARRLRFATGNGADRYLNWLETHAGDVLGRTRPERPLPLGSSALLVSLAPCGVCKKELPTYLAAWRDGDLVVSLLASGPGVDRVRFARLAGRVDARMPA